MIKAQIGTAADHVWIYHRFIEGLHDDVRKIVGPNVGPNDTIDEMTTRAHPSVGLPFTSTETPVEMVDTSRAQFRNAI